MRKQTVGVFKTKGMYLHLILFLLNRFWFERQIKLPASKHWILLLRNLHILERRGVQMQLCFKGKEVRQWIDNFSTFYINKTYFLQSTVGNLVWKRFYYIITSISKVTKRCVANKAVPFLNTSWWEEKKSRARNCFRVFQPICVCSR